MFDLPLSPKNLPLVLGGVLKRFLAVLTGRTGTGSDLSATWSRSGPGGSPEGPQRGVEAGGAVDVPGGFRGVGCYQGTSLLIKH